MKLPEIPKVISRRFALYSILVTTLLTSALFLIPESIIFMTSNYFKIAPLKKAIFVTHLVLCEEVQERVKRLSENDKNELSKFITQVLEKGPSEIQIRNENNTLINTLTSLIDRDMDSFVALSNKKAPEYCLIESLKNMGASALPAFSTLLKVSTTQTFEQSESVISKLISELLLNNSEAEMILRNKLIDPKQELTVNEASFFWIDYLKSTPNSIKGAMEIFQKISVTSNSYKLFLSNIASYCFNENTIHPEILKFITDTNQSTEKRIALLSIIRSRGFLSFLDSKSIVHLLNENNKGIFEIIQPFYQNRPIKSQEDLDAFIQLNLKTFQNFEFKKTEDWGRIDELIKILKSLTQKLQQNTNDRKKIEPISLSYLILTNELYKILNTIAEQLGYQSKSFSKLTDAVLMSPVRNEMLPYFEKLLKSKKEKTLSIKYLLQLEILSENTQNLMIEEILSSKAMDILEILKLLVHQRNRFQSDTDSVLPLPLLNMLTKLLNHTNEEVSEAAYNALIKQGEPIILYVREQLKNSSGKTKMSLLRIDWYFSSTENTFRSLIAELKSTKKCNLQYTLAFIETLPKSADSPYIKVMSASGGNTSFSQYLNGNPMFFIQQPPEPELFSKYLDCDVKYLNQSIIFMISKLSSKLKKTIEIKASKSSNEKKVFLLNSIKKAKVRIHNLENYGLDGG